MAVATLLPKERLRRTHVTDRRALLGDDWLPRETQPQAVRVPGLARAIHVKLASTRAEWEEALQLVADNYQARGYESSDAGDLRFTSYHALPDTVVLVAKAEGRVVATLSLVPDNTLLGLPLESIYRTEIQDLRRHGRRLFEPGSLASCDLSTREFIQVFLALQQLVWQCQVRQGADTAVIAVNPRHRAFYTKMLGFIPLGPRRAYARVQGHPAEAFYLNPKLMQARAPKMYEHMFGTPLPREVLVAPRLPEQWAKYFSRHSSLTRGKVVANILRYVAASGSPRLW